MSEMTARERYHATMHFEPGERTLLWEFGYWAATLERWYEEGLRRTPFSPPIGLPPGGSISGEGHTFPPWYTQGRLDYRDVDVHTLLGLDDSAVRLPLNFRLSPPFTETVLEETETTQLVINPDGVKVRVRKARDSVPQHLDWPVHDRASWEQVKEERFGPDIMARFPPRWKALTASYSGRGYPLGPFMSGFFSTARELLGLVRQLMMYYDDPELMHDINEHLVSIWLPMLEEIVSEVDLDFVIVWEDMAYKNAPLISPRLFEEFVVPYYKRVTSFLREHGVDIIFVDTDGDCMKLLPGFVEGGVTGLFPFEVQAGMDIVEVRKQYPQLMIQGGLDKNKVAEGRQAIDAELEAKLPFMLTQGGYVPYCDHLVQPGVPWDNFLYYRERVREYVERYRLE